jgi:hypothetical protein
MTNLRLPYPIIRLSALVACLLVGSMARMAFADASYSLQANENLNVLLNPNSSLAAWNAAQATPFQLAVARNSPYLMLENTSTTSTSELTQFNISIAGSDQTFNWIKVDMTDSDPGVSIVDESVQNQVLSMDISGLTPDKKLIFRVDFTPVDPSGPQFADYRNVFFKLDQADPTDGNADTYATFLDTATNTSVTTPQDNFWGNQTYPENLGDPIMGIQFPSKPHGDHVLVFDPTGNSTSFPVPEPSAFILAGLGGAALLGARQKFQKGCIAR